MICHIVFYRMKPTTNQAEENRLVEEARRRLPKVHGVRNLRAGRSLGGPSKDYSVALVMDFDDAAALEAYRVDEDHRRFVKEIAEPLIQEIWRFDFEA